MTENETAPATGPLLSDKLYDRLKFLAQVLLPGLGAAYFALADIWGLPKPTEVVGTITVVDTFLGLFLARQTSKYNDSQVGDGNMYVSEGETPTSKTVAFEIHTPAQELADKNEIRLKIKNE